MFVDADTDDAGCMGGIEGGLVGSWKVVVVTTNCISDISEATNISMEHGGETI